MLPSSHGHRVELAVAAGQARVAAAACRCWRRRALRLNSGHTAHVAEFAAICGDLAALVIAVFLLAPRFDDTLLTVIVFATSLAMMWSYALRGSLVYGFDISSEYYSLSQTLTSGVWHLSHPNDAYGAMLSLTILPAQLHALSGISALQIFKLVFPLVGAFFPVAVFSLARRALDGRWAFMAAALVIMQQTFFQQLPALAPAGNLARCCSPRSCARCSTPA